MNKFLIIALALVIGVIGGGFLEYKFMNNIEPEVIYVEDELTGWQLLEMAIIKTESDFNPLAIGTHNDLGIMQITNVYVKEVNRILDTTQFVHTDAFDPRKSLEMFNVIQNYNNSEHDIEKAINLHNPNGNAIGYTEKVLANFRYMSRMEEIRKAVKR